MKIIEGCTYYTKVTGNKIVQYRVTNPFKKSKILTPEEQSEEKQRHSNKCKGHLSSKSKARIREIIDIWATSIEAFNRNNKKKGIRKAKCLRFLTLTLPAKQMHSDYEIKRYIFNSFIVRLKQAGVSFNYLAVAEAQQNGNIHFHLIIDKYIERRLLLDYWNNALKWGGYLDRFKEVHGDKDPQGVYIQQIRKINKVMAYVTKYITAKNNVRPIDGRLWSCSEALEQMTAYETTKPYVIERFEEVCPDEKKFLRYEYDYCNVLIYKGSLLELLEHYSLGEALEAHYLKEFNDLYLRQLVEETQPIAMHARFL